MLNGEYKICITILRVRAFLSLYTKVSGGGEGEGVGGGGGTKIIN